MTPVFRGFQWTPTVLHSELCSYKSAHITYVLKLLQGEGRGDSTASIISLILKKKKEKRDIRLCSLSLSLISEKSFRKVVHLSYP